MAFLRVKHIGNGDYLYLVQNYRNGDKVYQDIIEYRGRIGGNSKARAPYNTLRRQFHLEMRISTTKEPFLKGNGTSPTPGEMRISTTKEPFFKRKGTKDSPQVKGCPYN